MISSYRATETLIATLGKAADEGRFYMRFVLPGLLLFSTGVALSTIVGVILNYSPVPYWDSWYGIVHWYIEAEHHWWPMFWSLHNEHRLLFSRLVFWPDMRWFGGVNVLSQASTLVICGILTLTVYRVAVYQTGMSSGARWTTGCIVVAFCFSWMQTDNFTWAFQNQWFAVNLFALLAFQCLAVSRGRHYSNVWFALALLSAISSCFSMANGSIVWLLLIALIFYWRFPVRFVFLTIILATVEVAAYYWDAKGATGTLPHGTFVYVVQHQPVDWVHYAISYLGSPMWYAFHRSSFAFIAGMMVIFGVLAGLPRASGGHEPKALPLLAFAAFLYATAFATGAGRLTLGLGTVFQTRYATNALLAWMALLLFWMLNCRWRPLQYALYAATFISLVAIAICQPAALQANTKVLFERLVAGQAVREGVFDHAYLGVLWDHDDYLKGIIEAARQERLTILAPSTVGYDDPPPRIQTDERCAGYVDGSAPTMTPGKSLAEGWVFDQPSETVPQTIAVTDGNGNTIGNGVVGKKRSDAAAVMRTSHVLLGWVAFYKTTPQAHFFAKIAKAHYCRIS